MIVQQNQVYTLGDMAGRPPTKEAPPFGKKLAAIRQGKGLSQEALAKRLNTTRANIAYYERNATNPTLEFIQRCAGVLGISVADLIASGGIKPNGKPGPVSRLQEQIQQVQNLPHSKQRFVSDFLDTFLKQIEKVAS